MKKIYNYLFVGIVAMLSMTLSSCNDDNIARDLDGIWEGEVSQNWSWRWSDYTTYQYVDIVINQLEVLRNDIVINRITVDTKIDDLIEPFWLTKKFCVLNEIDKEMVKRDTYQGKKIEE